MPWNLWNTNVRRGIVLIAVVLWIAGSVYVFVRGGLFTIGDAPPVPVNGTKPDKALPFLKEGEWITTTDGRKVCRNRWDLYWYHPLNANFCDDRQPGFSQLTYGQIPPWHEGWVRPNIGGGIQMHTERGWVP